MSSQPKTKYPNVAIFLSGVPLLAYLTTFAYQCGFANYFHIPLEVVELDIVAIFISLFAIVGSLYFFYLMFSFAWFYFPKETDPVSTVKRRYFTIIYIAAIVPILFYRDKVAWIFYIVFCVVVAFVEFVFPLIKHRDKEKYSEKLIAQSRVNIEDGKRLLWHQVDKRLGRWFVTSAIYSAIILQLSYQIGRLDAKSEDQFMITEGGQVVLAIYDNLAVLSNIEPGSNRLSGEFEFERITDVSSKLKWKKLGSIKGKDIE